MPQNLIYFHHFVQCAIGLSLVTLLALYLSTVSDWSEWSTWDALRSRIWSKIVQNVRNISAVINYYKYNFFNPCGILMVFLGTNINLAASRSRCSKDGFCVFEVSDSRTICLCLPAMSLEVSPDTISGDPSGGMLGTSTSVWCGTDIHIGPYLGPWFYGSILS